MPTVVLFPRGCIIMFYPYCGGKMIVNGLEAWLMETDKVGRRGIFFSDTRGDPASIPHGRPFYDDFPHFEGIVTKVAWGIRVWKRDQNGVETEVTSGDPVAVVQRTSFGQGNQQTTWDCPGCALNPTDSIVVRMYIQFWKDEWVSGWIWEPDMPQIWTTNQLGASQLNATTWTVNYATFFREEASGYRNFGIKWGVNSYYPEHGWDWDTCIENFSYTT